MLNIGIQDHDGSLPGPPQRPTVTDPEHAAVVEFRETVRGVQHALARVVDVHHVDDTIVSKLTAVNVAVADLHAALDTEHAAWLETAEAERQAETARILAEREAEVVRRAALTPEQRAAEDEARAAAAKAKRIAQLKDELATLAATKEG